MTYEDVDRACAVLEQAGRTPSGNTVLAMLKARGLPASKRTVLKYLKLRRPAPATGLATAIDDDPVYHVAPASAQAPAVHQQPLAVWQRFSEHHRQQQARTAAAMAPDPVPTAEAALVEARHALVHAKLALIATRDVVVDGIVRGSLHPHDPAGQQALDDVQLCKQEYDRCWAALAEAMVQRQQGQQRAQVARQETWVLAHRPELVTELRRAEETYQRVQRLPDDAQKPKAHYAARFVLRQARAAYQQALAQAPVPSPNGTHAEEA